MNGLDRIGDKIIEEANLEAAKIIEEAEKKALEIKNQAVAKAEAERSKIDSQYREKQDELKRRLLSNANLDMRKRVLDTKQRMIDRAFDECLNKVSGMPVEDYRSLIKDMLLQSVVTGDEEVIFSKQDDERLDSYIITEVNDQLKAMGKKGALLLSQEKGEFKAGFILRSGGMEINSTFESLLRMIRQEIEPQVAEILFA